MKTEKITVSFDAEKLQAIKIFAPDMYADLENQLTGYLEKTQEQEYHPVERKVPESVESKLKDPKQCWLCGSDERSMMDYFRPAGKRAYGLYRDRRRRLLFPYGADVGLRDFRSIGGLRGR